MLLFIKTQILGKGLPESTIFLEILFTSFYQSHNSP